MARALLVCRRRGLPAETGESDVLRLIERITPDNAPRERPVIGKRNGVVAAVFNGGAGNACVDGASIRLGVLASSGSDEWARPLAPVPEGSFALCRVSADLVELVADAAATRTLWYACTNDLFVASTSQRAIVALLGDFEPNREAAAWMLSSATLGPGLGWDLRVHPVAPGARVVLDRRQWRIRVHAARVEISDDSRAADPVRQERVLGDVVQRAVAAAAPDHSRWILPLSGGVDSRGLLLALLRGNRRATRPRCVTWGRRGALAERDGDAYIARAVAEQVGVEHEFLPVERAGRSPRALLRRFFAAGEGRVAALSGYLDGFDVWNALTEQGVEGIIRGDEAFGWKPVTGERDVRHKVRMTLLEDIFDAQARASIDLPRQRIPEELDRRTGEPLAGWRDRLYQQFRLPCMLSALTDLKSPYVEVSNPLLHSSVLAEARRLPEELRTDKRLWQRLVGSWLPGVPFAKRSAETPIADALNDPRLLELFVEELRSDAAAEILGPGAVEMLVSPLERKQLGVRSSRLALPARLASLWPRGRRIWRRRFKARLDPAVLGFRATIVTRMSSVLREDADFLAGHARALQRPPRTGE